MAEAQFWGQGGCESGRVCGAGGGFAHCVLVVCLCASGSGVAGILAV
jgi:hypothetical protein